MIEILLAAIEVRQRASFGAKNKTWIYLILETIKKTQCYHLLKGNGNIISLTMQSAPVLLLSESSDTSYGAA